MKSLHLAVCGCLRLKHSASFLLLQRAEFRNINIPTWTSVNIGLICKFPSGIMWDLHEIGLLVPGILYYRSIV